MADRIDQLERKVDDLAATFDRRFAAVDAAFLEQRQYTEFAFGTLDGKIGNLEAKMDGRFASVETRMDTGFARVDSRFGQLEAKMDTRFGQAASRFDRLERKLDDFIKKQGEANEAQQQMNEAQRLANQLVDRRLNRLE